MGSRADDGGSGVGVWKSKSDGRGGFCSHCSAVARAAPAVATWIVASTLGLSGVTGSSSVDAIVC